MVFNSILCFDKYIRYLLLLIDFLRSNLLLKGSIQGTKKSAEDSALEYKGSAASRGLRGGDSSYGNVFVTNSKGYHGPVCVSLNRIQMSVSKLGGFLACIFQC